QLAPSLRHRVVSKSSRQRMASQQPLHPQPHPSQNSESFDCLVRVARTGGLESAAPCKQNREIHLIDTQRRQRRFHAWTLPLAPLSWRSMLRSFLACPCVSASSRRVLLQSRRLFAQKLFTNRNNSLSSAANAPRATLLFG